MLGFNIMTIRPDRPYWSRLLLITTIAWTSAELVVAQQQINVPAPTTPLITCDPYFSVWSTGKKLTDKPTTHWTGKPHRLVGIIAIDGVAHRFLGDEPQKVSA